MDEKGLGKCKMRIVLAIFANRFEVHGSLKPFFEQYPQYAELKDKRDNERHPFSLH